MRTRVAVLAFSLSVAFAIPASAEVVVGLFSNYGTTCSFNDNNPGLVTAHVVVHPHGEGIRGVRFAAPIPECFDAVFVEEVLGEGLYSIGDSQTGISIALPWCLATTTRVLDITYYSNGSTTTCCPFPVVADPYVGMLEAVDCAFNTIPMTGKTSYLNADTTCVCTEPADAPSTPSDPIPTDGAGMIDTVLRLRWSSTDPNDLPVRCDLYLGTDPDPPMVAFEVPDTPGYPYFFFDLPRLFAGRTYYWRVVARNAGGAEAAGPTWTFTTVPNYSPQIQLLEPDLAGINLPLTPTLKWVGTDETPLTYDVYFGEVESSLPKVASGISAQQFTPASLAFETTYYWRVVAHDLDGASVSSETWYFTTKPENLPPNEPGSPSPANLATNVAVSTTLRWQCTDPEGQPLTFDIYFGTASDPPLIASNRTAGSYAISHMTVETVYYWRILARDSTGRTRSSPTWSFTTRLNIPPAVPSNPTPGNGYWAQPINSVLRWSCSDPDQQPLVYDVYFGTVAPPPLIATGVTIGVYNPGTQAYLTKYYWRIVARDTKGAQTSGPTWSYTTKSADEPPAVPSYPTPGDGATAQPVNSVLRWNASDPENQPLNFDVYFGTTETPPLVADHIATKSYNPGMLAPATVYRWRVVARDPAGQETSGPLWNFRTSSTSNVPPLPPSNPWPASGTTITTTTPLLSWQGGDPDGDALTYDVFMFIDDVWPEYLGTTSSPSFQVTQPLPAGWGFQWYVWAHDQYWYTQGPMWSFAITSSGVPVAFKAFDAEQRGAGIEVRWELSSDETMESFALYRRESPSDNAVEVMRGTVDRADGSYLDTAVHAGRTYRYELLVRAAGGDEFRSPVATVKMEPLELTLHQNTPNPFNPQTSIRYDLPASARVRLVIFDVSGRLVRTLMDEDQTAGPHEATWTGRDDAGNGVPSGVYFYVLDVGKQRLTKKLVLLK